MEIIMQTQRDKDISVAWRNILIGGNHLANALVYYGCFPGDYKNYEEVADKFNPILADIWVAWKTIKDAQTIFESLDYMKEKG